MPIPVSDAFNPGVPGLTIDRGDYTQDWPWRGGPGVVVVVEPASASQSYLCPEPQRTPRRLMWGLRECQLDSMEILQFSKPSHMGLPSFLLLDNNISMFWCGVCWQLSNGVVTVRQADLGNQETQMKTDSRLSWLDQASLSEIVMTFIVSTNTLISLLQTGDFQDY